MVKLLVEYEAEVHQYDPVQQMSPLFLAIKLNNHQIIDLILKHSKQKVNITEIQKQMKNHDFSKNQ